MMIDIFKSIGLFFVTILANPLWYVGLIVIYFLSSQRVKQEREAFHTRVYSRLSDWTIPIIPAVIAGLSLSLITAGLGIVLSKEFIALLVAMSVLTVLTFHVRWMTPAYVLGFMLLLYGSEPFFKNSKIMDTLIYQPLSTVPMFVVAGLLALFVVVEGFLILKNGSRYTSPKLERSKRGKWIGSHETKRLWIVPVLFFIPEGLIPSSSFWPIFSLGDGGWQPILLPFFIGFNQQVRAVLPAGPIRLIGLRVLCLGIFFVILAAASFYVPFLAIVLGGLAIVSRELLSFAAKTKDGQHQAYFMSQRKGCIVLGVLPGSPAEKMKLAIGETIVKVNGQAVNGEESLYKALQLNSAFCKLDVINTDGEIRFVQGALYDGEHHQLGVLLVKDDIELQDSII
ncbi:PDZ domain-containing protein [bacterium LRH843]|nr:PDZ domain-containing protein [bacterium LRH843]